MIDLWIGSLTILLAVVVALFKYNKLEPKWLRLFVVYLLITLLVQPFGYYFSKYTGKSNHFIFNSHQYLQFCFYIFLFYKSVIKKPLRLTIAIILTVFLSFALSNIYFGQGFYIYNSHTYSVGSILTLMCCIIYFWELFTSPEVQNYFYLPMFWIGTGILFYFAGSVVYLSFFDYITARNLDPDGNVYMLIMLTLNIMLYSMITFGFLTKKAK
jgi:hypothetical protein